MKYIYLFGGLGNCLFQINFGEFLKTKGYNVRYCTLLLEESFLTDDLLKVKTHKSTIDNLLSLDAVSKSDLVKGSILDLLFLLLSKYLGQAILGRMFCPLNWRISQIENINYYLGHLQLHIPISSILTARMKEAVNSIFVSHDLRSYTKIVSDSTLVIHFRGGDYFDDKNRHLLTPLKYYENVLNLVGSKVVVTDDKTMAKNILAKSDDQDITFNSSESGLIDFCLLCCAKRLATTNSTFSWWASEIGDAIEIYQPDPYFAHVEWPVETNKLHRRVGINYAP